MAIQNLFQRLLSPKDLPPIEECSVDFVFLDESRMQRAFRQFMIFPLSFWQRLRNTWNLVRHAELREPLARNKCPMRWISDFPSLAFNMAATATPAIMKAFMKQARVDPENGVFHDEMVGQLWLPLLRDLFPEETIEANDFFLSVHKNFLSQYRQPILKFIGAQNIRRHGEELESIVQDTVRFWKEKTEAGRINCSELAPIFTTTIISRLLLGHPGPHEIYLEIAEAINCLNQCIMKRAFWRRALSKKEQQKYEQAIRIVRQAIDISLMTTEKPYLGSLVDTLKEDGVLTQAQIKTTLFMMYLGGAEATGSLLIYLLWQLGRHPEYQEEIYQELCSKEGALFEKVSDSVTLDRLFSESIRLFTPVYVTGRYPAKELACVIKDGQGKEVFRKRISKKWGVLLCPTLAARDPAQYENPDEFNPHRFETVPRTLPWFPFGDGKHSCPGQWLAKAEILTLVGALVQQFHLQSFPETQVKCKGHIALRVEDVVSLHLSLREN